MAITTDTVCQGSDTNDLVVITRQGPGCTFPESTRGLWNSTVLGINVAEQNMEIRVDDNTTVSFQCHRQDLHYYMLRNTKTYLKYDGLMCLKLDVFPDRHQIVFAILKGGKALNDTVKLIYHSKPAYLFVDCKWTSFNSTEYILSEVK